MSDDFYGSFNKFVTSSERAGYIEYHRGVHAFVDIKKGTVITDAMVKIMRPYNSIKPANLSLVVGKRAMVDIARNTGILWEHLELVD